jgi:hypothetical protein
MRGSADMAAAERQRDARLRKVILRCLYRSAVGPKGGLSGEAMLKLAKSEAIYGDDFEGEGHALRLARDLVRAEYATERDLRRRTTEIFGLDTLFFCVSSKGSALLDERIPPDLMVDDERNLEE